MTFPIEAFAEITLVEVEPESMLIEILDTPSVPPVVEVVTGSVLSTLLPVQTLPNQATITPDVAFGFGIVNALSQNTTIANPVGTPGIVQQYMFRITTTTARMLTWGNMYRGGLDLPLPGNTTGLGKTDYFGFIWNSLSAKFDFIAQAMGY